MSKVNVIQFLQFKILFLVLISGWDLICMVLSLSTISGILDLIKTHNQTTFALFINHTTIILILHYTWWFCLVTSFEMHRLDEAAAQTYEKQMQYTYSTQMQNGIWSVSEELDLVINTRSSESKHELERWQFTADLLSMRMRTNDALQLKKRVLNESLNH